ncbi:hypothetical protein ACHMW6_10290 [Pseudoduganella sp. UC29_106]|uniref:hypothetical protein n=1 Tax=Pseudoduganella sp. UC29_106 TaxID=3374553 RepID=UPI0037581E67
MSKIIGAHFQLQEETDRAREALVAAGFPDDRISNFFVSDAGQHAVTPIGGDHIVSPGAKESPEGAAKGMATGGAIGAALGAATVPVTGPLGPVIGGLVGAHVGSLYSFSHMKEAGEQEDGSVANQVEPRRGGMMVAVAVDGQSEQKAIDIFRQLGTHHIERAEGTIENRDWRDFNPVSVPDWV